MATATAAPPEYTTREQLAELAKPALGEKPQTASDIARAVGIIGADERLAPNHRLHEALRILEARHEAKHLGRAGWVAGDAEIDAPIPTPATITFPYVFKIVPTADMFIDKAYQRPLTSFADKIAANFDAALFGTLCLSDRGAGEGAKRHAIIDGQTRWTGARRAGVEMVPCIVYAGMSVQDEARTFARLQKERRGMTSWHRFRADLAAGSELALAVRDIAEGAGFTLGDASGELKAVAALETAYKSSPFLLERAMFALRAAIKPPGMPGASHIRGLHYWYRNPRNQFRSKDAQVDDERLVRRLQTTGLGGLERRANAARDLEGKAANSGDIYMARAIDSVYRGAK